MRTLTSSWNVRQRWTQWWLSHRSANRIRSFLCATPYLFNTEHVRNISTYTINNWTELLHKRGKRAPYRYLYFLIAVVSEATFGLTGIATTAISSGRSIHSPLSSHRAESETATARKSCAEVSVLKTKLFLNPLVPSDSNIDRSQMVAIDPWSRNA